ncbi:hypothetical protein PRZ48_015205 [Zasmidium cellare]|uniref:CUE domain-containing protein n=1 Tax=Zasmidium cellare TaxID=395010 RepID=A0ABR0DXX4_ZASCE|nr:hypothetical protein PRZ48_015205 [Zasmidium cellare]
MGKGKQEAIGHGHHEKDSRDELVARVQEIYPHLGRGFILKLLIHYHDDVRQLANDLQDNSLPAHLSALDWSEQTTTNAIHDAPLRQQSDVYFRESASAKSESDVSGLDLDEECRRAGKKPHYCANPDQGEFRAKLLINDAIDMALISQLHFLCSNFDAELFWQLEEFDEFDDEYKAFIAEVLPAVLSMYDATQDWCRQTEPNARIRTASLDSYCASPLREAKASQELDEEPAPLLVETTEEAKHDRMQTELAPAGYSEHICEERQERPGHSGIPYRQKLASQVQGSYPDLGACFLRRLLNKYQDCSSLERQLVFDRSEHSIQNEGFVQTTIGRDCASETALPSPDEPMMSGGLGQPTSPSSEEMSTASDNSDCEIESGPQPSAMSRSHFDSAEAGPSSHVELPQGIATVLEGIRRILEASSQDTLPATDSSLPLWDRCIEWIQEKEQDDYLDFEETEGRWTKSNVKQGQDDDFDFEEAKRRFEEIKLKQEQAGLQSCDVFRLNTALRVQQAIPELGLGFIMKLIDEYMDDWRQVIEDCKKASLPPKLAVLDRFEQLPSAFAELLPTLELFGELEAPSVDELRFTMLSRGWCPHQVDYFVALHSRQELIKFATQDRRRNRPESHEACLAETRCIAYNTPPGRPYDTAHTTICQELHLDCHMVKIPEEELLNIIRTGGVPLISIAEDATHRLFLRVHRRGFRSNYATVSHVWADGLGNPLGNSLPVCQVRRIQSALNWITDTQRERGKGRQQFADQLADDHVDRKLFDRGKYGMVWMDTLCIPVGKGHESLRTQCIDAMASIYAGSSAVIVLDKELMRTKLPSNPRLTIAPSVWMSRSWTLQEAILPATCVFEFMDGYYAPPRGLTSFGLRRTNGASLIEGLLRADYSQTQQDFDEIDDDVPLDALAADFHRLRDAFCVPKKRFKEPVTGTTRIHSFISTWNALVGRGTTMTDDLYVVLASCLDFKLRQFRHWSTTEEKMHRMIFSQDLLPCSLFFNPGPRLTAGEHHYNRWVPSKVSNHLLTHGSTFSLPRPGISKYSDQGMRLTLHLGPDISAFLVDGIVGPLLRYNMVAGKSIYRIESILAEHDDFNFEGCIATCILMEATSSFNRSVTHGACFAVTTLHEPSASDSRSLEMIYHCPILVTSVGSKDIALDEDVDVPEFPAHDMSPAHQPFVKFSPIRDSKPLKRQGAVSDTAYMKAIITTCMLVPFFAVSLWLILAFIVIVVGLIRLVMGYETGGFIDFFSDISGSMLQIAVAILAPFFWWAKYLDKWNPPSVWLGFLVWALLALLSLGVPLLLFIGAWILFSVTLGYAVVRLSDYIFLYQSYDDNTVAQKILRLAKAVSRSPYDGLRVLVTRLRESPRRERVVEEIDLHAR